MNCWMKKIRKNKALIPKPKDRKRRKLSHDGFLRFYVPSLNAGEKKACHEKWNMVQSLDVSNPEKVLSLLLQK